MERVLMSNGIKSKYIVLDTNVLLLDANNLLSIGADGTTIVLPSTVLGEIDGKKNGHGEIQYQARSCGRLLASGEVTDVSAFDYAGLEGSGSSTTIKIGDVTVIVLSVDNYQADKNHESYNDQKIIEIALLSETLFGKDSVKFMTNDVWCRLQALASGLSVLDFKVIDKESYQFIKDIQIGDEEEFRCLHGSDIITIDPEYALENFNYKFTHLETGQTKLAIIVNGVVSILGKETEKELRKQDITPINSEQLFFSKVLQDPLIDVVVCESLSGSGKTLLALSNGIKMVKQKSYDGILYVRASVNDVDSIEEVGFLPGSSEKFDVYLHPLHDSLEAIARNRLKSSKAKNVELEDKVAEIASKLMSECNITATTTLGMRGRTYNNMFIIIDEVQNQSRNSLVKVLTRVGKNCKVVLIGSNRQIDNSYVTQFNNGLSLVLNSCTKAQYAVRIHAVTLQKVVRSTTAEWAERVFSKDKSLDE